MPSASRRRIDSILYGFPELVTKLLGNFHVGWTLLLPFPLHTRHAPSRQPAGNDQIVVAQVGIDVQGQAVHGDPAGDAHSEG